MAAASSEATARPRVARVEPYGRESASGPVGRVSVTHRGALVRVDDALGRG